MSNTSFKRCPTHFSREKGNFLGDLSPYTPPGYGPVLEWSTDSAAAILGRHNSLAQKFKGEIEIVLRLALACFDTASDICEALYCKYWSVLLFHRCDLAMPVAQLEWGRRGHVLPETSLLRFFAGAFRPVFFSLFCCSAPLKIFWRTNAPYLLKHLNSCTLFTDTSPVSPT